MKPRLYLLIASVFLLSVAAGSAVTGRFGTQASKILTASQTQSAFEQREAAYRANNIGVALLEQFKTKEAIDSFRQALNFKSDLLLARINLALALYYLPDVDSSKQQAELVVKAAPDEPHAHYLLGLIARGQNRLDDAAAEFQRVLKVEPEDAGGNINLGQVLVQQKKQTEAIAAFRKAVAAEPYHETALYNLGLLLTRSGQREEGQQLIQKFQQLKASGAGVALGTNYLEGGRYAEAVVSTGAETELVDKKAPEVTFSDITDTALPPFAELKSPRSRILGQAGGDAALFDFDNDGDLDLVEVASGSQRLLRNDGGRFVDVTKSSGDLQKESDGVAIAVVAGDLDNDGRSDLFVLRYGRNSVYHNESGGKFSDATVASRIPAYKFLSSSVALLDYDHDGDLDILIGGGSDPSGSLKAEEKVEKNPPNFFFTISLTMPAAPGMLLRNNGDGTFIDQTSAARLSSVVQTRAIIPTDYDNRRDVDLLVDADPLRLLRNLRDGTFQDTAPEVGLGLGDRLLTSVAVGDINKDGNVDFFFGGGEPAGYFAISDGRGHFQTQRGPGELVVEPNAFSAQYNNASQLVDFDNDGLLDLVTLVSARNDSHYVMKLRIWRNVGDGWSEFRDNSLTKIQAKVLAVSEAPGKRFLLSGDIDGDGDTDFIFGSISGGLRLARNDGGNRNHSVKVALHGRISNRSAIQTKVEVRAGSLYQRLETYSASPAPAPADLIFGLGKRERPDALRVTWPAGIIQAETDFPKSNGSFAKLDITELDRKPSSCPYLYTWNGEQFEFITDFMGGGEMGYLEAPANGVGRPVYNRPDPVEYVRIRDDQLRPKDGLYELRVTNELEEAMFVDRLQLLAVAHPMNTEVLPNEGMSSPEKPFKLFMTRDARPPVRAVDDRGNDVLPLISHMDRRWPADFAVDRIRGYAEEHSLTLTLPVDSGIQGPNSKVVLMLTGWTDYAWSSDNVAAAQAAKAMTPPSLQVKNQKGKWQTVIEDIGIPVGRPQTVTVDLTNRFLSASREVRILTNMRIYWDQILFASYVSPDRSSVTALDPVRADLRWRGYSAEVTPDGREPFGYEYQKVYFLSPWKVMTGRYTREGDVRDLLFTSDDRFVVSRTGDEIALAFDAQALPPLPKGWRRTFLLYADGFSKEMDINSASPDQLAPMPFHAMTRYPYHAPEHYPADAKHLEYLEKYNTRVVRSQVPRLF